MKTHKIKVTLGYHGTRTEAEYIRDAALNAAEAKAFDYKANVSSRTELTEVERGTSVLLGTSSAGRIPELDEALKSPLDYSISFSFLGWTLSWDDSETALCISKEEALRFIAAVEAAISNSTRE